MLNELLTRRVLLILGKGGVGRTTVSAALGLVAARAGARVCIIEYDSQAPMAALFGHQPSYEPVEVEPGMSLIALDGPRTLAEYLRLTLPSTAMLHTILSSRLYNHFVPAAPGLRELIMIGKLYHEIERRPQGQPPWDLVIFDGPASGQALDLLRMPLTAEETFGASIVGREARNVAAFLRDRRRCVALQVATGDRLTVSETLEFHTALGGIGMAPAALIFNRRFSLPFDGAAIERLAGRVADGNRPAASRFISRARRLLIAARRDAEAIRQLQDVSGSLIALANYPEARGRPLIEALVAELEELRSCEQARQTTHASSG
jgi:anion-transporting  ArsA/GET3 family ATPase